MRHDQQSEVLELLAAWEEFDLGLRLGDGFSQGAYTRLREALAVCSQAWSQMNAIPRLAANVLVDIFPATEANADQYGGPTSEQIREHAYKLQDLVRDCVAVEEG